MKKGKNSDTCTSSEPVSQTSKLKPVGVQNSATSCLSILQKRRERSAQETAPD
jgi:hypothetical protein